MNPQHPQENPKGLPRWLVLAASSMPVLVMLGYFYLKPEPERLTRVRPPGPTVPIYNPAASAPPASAPQVP